MKFIRTMLAIYLVSWFLATTFYVAKIDSAVRQQRQTIEHLKNDFNKTQAELAGLRHQQEFNNAVTEDLSSRLAEAQGWK